MYLKEFHFNYLSLYFYGFLRGLPFRSFESEAGLKYICVMFHGDDLSRKIFFPQFTTHNLFYQQRVGGVGCEAADRVC